jgi:hypothetical protein
LREGLQPIIRSLLAAACVFRLAEELCPV